MGGIFAIIVLVLDVLAIVDIFKSSKPRGKKILWVLFVAIFPLLGMGIYFILSKKKKV